MNWLRSKKKSLDQDKEGKFIEEVKDYLMKIEKKISKTKLSYDFINRKVDEKKPSRDQEKYLISTDEEQTNKFSSFHDLA